MTGQHMILFFINLLTVCLKVCCGSHVCHLCCPSPRTSHSYWRGGSDLTKQLLSSYRFHPGSEESQLTSTRGALNYSNSVLLPQTADWLLQQKQWSARVRMDRWKLLQAFKIISHNSYTNKTGSCWAVFILLWAGSRWGPGVLVPIVTQC